MQKFVYNGNTVEAESFEVAALRYREIAGTHPDNLSIVETEGDYVFLKNSADIEPEISAQTDVVPAEAPTNEAPTIPLGISDDDIVGTVPDRDMIVDTDDA